MSDSFTSSIDASFSTSLDLFAQSFKEILRLCQLRKSSKSFQLVDSLLISFKNQLQTTELQGILLSDDSWEYALQNNGIPPIKLENYENDDQQHYHGNSINTFEKENQNGAVSDLVVPSERLGRTRSLSSGDIIFPRHRSSSSRINSPNEKRKLDTSEMIKKQAKARELRENLLNEKSGRHKSKSDKIQAVRERHLSQTQQLRESIEEKQTKAERLRELYIGRIKTKAADELQKLDEIAFISSLSFENKRMEVQQRHLESEARLADLEDERHKKQSEAAALKEAALERRKIQEVERVAKIERENQRRKEFQTKKELEKQNSIAQKAASKVEKVKTISKLKQFQSTKKAEVEVLRRGLTERLNKSAQRYVEHIGQRKEKAAAANQYSKLFVKLVANKVNQSRGPGYKKIFCIVCSTEAWKDNCEHIPCDHSLNTTPNSVDEGKFTTINTKDKPLKRRTKRLRQRMCENAVNYQYYPPTQKQSTNIALQNSVNVYIDKIKVLFRKLSLKSYNLPGDLTPETLGIKEYEELEKSFESLDCLLNEADMIELYLNGGIDLLVMCCVSIDCTNRSIASPG
ncbi:hypothetical protein HK096_005998, partial [Nowakowskiella sp. JEL0078]